MGIGICIATALKGYRVIICMPQKMSGEKLNTMKALGAEILRTPTEAAWDAEDSHIFLSAGIAKKLKEKIPGVQIVGVDPYGSILAVPDSLNDGSARTGQKRLTGYHVEGIGYDFQPTVLDGSLADHWVKVDDDESFTMCREIIRHEGLMIGGSCGSVMAGAYRFIREKNIGAGKRVAVLFADSSRNYMSKFLEDDWFTKNGLSVADANRCVNEKGAHREIYKIA